MAIELVGDTSGTIVGSGEEASKPLHTANHPLAGHFYRYSGFTGTIGAAAAAGTEIFQFRFVSGAGKNFAVVTKIIFDGIGIVAVATALGQLGFMVKVARSWTVAGSGGTRIATTADNLQMRTANPASQVNDIGIATTAALTAGTKTLDANAIGQTVFSTGTGAVTTYQLLTVGEVPLVDPGTSGGSPLVLANQEGFVIHTTHAGATALTYQAGFTVEWAEVTAF